MNTRIVWPNWNTLVNDAFIHLVDNKSRYLILYGGRGSSKSAFITDQIIYRMLTHKYFRFLIIRKVHRTIRGSIFQSLKDRIYELKLESMFIIRESYLEVECINGNKVIAAGLDDVAKIKSVKDPTGCWVEEDITEESDFITITTSIRSTKADFLQEIYTINPEVEGDFEDNYFWKKFFTGESKMSFDGKTTNKIDGRDVSVNYTVHHSTYHDNRWLPDDYKSYLESLKETNPYYYEIYTLGHWGNRITGGQFYKNFLRSKHVEDISYDPDLPLHITFDFNVHPHMSLAVCQSIGKHLYIIDEIAPKDPDNNTKATCDIFKRKFPNHTSGMTIYGDPAGKHEDTRSEKGFNDYSIISKELAQYNPRFRVAKAAPSVRGRGDFIDSILAINEQGIKFTINSTCNIVINDYIMGKEASDGNKLKERVKDKDTGITYEKHHHFTDALDYLICEMFKSEYRRFKRGGKKSSYGEDEYRPTSRSSFANY